MQDCEVRFRVGVLQEFRHADRREGRDDGRVGLFIGKFDCIAARHPAAPGKSDGHCRDGADGYALEKTSPQLAAQN